MKRRVQVLLFVMSALTACSSWHSAKRVLHHTKGPNGTADVVICLKPTSSKTVVRDVLARHDMTPKPPGAGTTVPLIARAIRADPVNHEIDIFLTDASRRSAVSADFASDPDVAHVYTQRHVETACT